MKSLSSENAFLAFSEFEAFWTRLAPDTPFGKDSLGKLPYSNQAEELENLWDQTEKLLAFLEAKQSDPLTLDKLRHHLRRLPRFPESAQDSFNEIDLFQFKKFLHNYRCILALLDEDLKAFFGLTGASVTLEAQLQRGQMEAETFFISDVYLATLADVRQEIRSTDEALRSLAQKHLAAIEARFGLAFGEREFLILPKSQIPVSKELSRYLTLTPFDEDKLSLQPLPPPEALPLQEHRLQLQTREQSLEKQVLETLSQLVNEALPQLRQCREAIGAFDLAFAKSRLARQYHLVRPILGQKGCDVRQGRFIPCLEACEQQERPYAAVDLKLESNVNVFFGSNMGGKTVLLKSLAFFQLCAQCGLFVPAAHFQTSLYASFHFLGERPNTAKTPSLPGLSGFGMEIYHFLEASRDFQGPTLVLFDEFARTTNSLEAEHLIFALTRYFAKRTHVFALFSTHFRGVKRLNSVGYHRMKGLDRSKLKKGMTEKQPIQERIHQINQAMDYRVIPDDPAQPITDALEVAMLLGLSKEIAGAAEE